MAAQHFEARLERRGRGVLVEVPFDVRATFEQARPPVRRTIDSVQFEGAVEALRRPET